MRYEHDKNKSNNKTTTDSGGSSPEKVGLRDLIEETELACLVHRGTPLLEDLRLHSGS